MRCNRADARRSLDANSDRRRFPPVRRYALERRNGHGAGQGCRLTDQTMVASSSAGRITAVIHGLSPSSALRRERGRGGSKCNGKSLITYTRTTGLPRVSQALYSQPVYVWSWWASKTAQETTPTGPEHARVQSVSQLPSAVKLALWRWRAGHLPRSARTQKPFLAMYATSSGSPHRSPYTDT